MLTMVRIMFVKRKVRYSTLFTNLVGWHARAVSFPLSDIILALLACPLSDVTFYLHSGITNLSFYKHWARIPKFFGRKHVIILAYRIIDKEKKFLNRHFYCHFDNTFLDFTKAVAKS
jgi:hypothetical protein